jgi:TonB family protein
MRPILAVLALALAAFGQTMPKRIPPDEATKHLIKQFPAFYPSSAQTGRIQGIVVLEISIDESGRASVRRLVSGHPMLAPAAIDSVNQWKYQPFEVDGKPTTVVTFVTVSFGGTSRQETDAAAHIELMLVDNFWTAEESAQAALAKGDHSAAEHELNRAQEVLTSFSNGRVYQAERWQWMISMGRLAMARQKYDEAEQYYKKA